MVWGHRRLRASLSLLPWSSAVGRESLRMQGRCPRYWAGSMCGAQVLAGWRPQTDHVISGPMRGLKKNCTQWRRHKDIQIDGQGDSMSNLAQRGQVSKKRTPPNNFFWTTSTKMCVLPSKILSKRPILSTMFYCLICLMSCRASTLLA